MKKILLALLIVLMASCQNESLDEMNEPNNSLNRTSFSFKYKEVEYRSSYTESNGVKIWEDISIGKLYDDLQQLPELVTYVKEDNSIEFYENPEENPHEPKELPNLRATNFHYWGTFSFSIFENADFSGKDYVARKNLQNSDAGTYLYYVPYLSDLGLDRTVSSFSLHGRRFASSERPINKKTMMRLTFYEGEQLTGRSLSFEISSNNDADQFGIAKALKNYNWDNKPRSFQLYFW